MVITDIAYAHEERHGSANACEGSIYQFTGDYNYCKQQKNTAIIAVKSGAYDYIEKPFNLGTLSKIVKLAVEKRILLENNK